MKLFKRLFKKPLAASTTQNQIRAQPGPLTFLEAWEIARPAALEFDDKPQLILITSGTDIRSNGRSFSWEFLFHLPKRRARLMVSLFPSEKAELPEDAPIVLFQRVTPCSESERFRPLPETFRDSPEVVAELSAQGVDFISGPTDMKIESRMLPNGQVRWICYYWNNEYAAEFERTKSE